MQETLPAATLGKEQGTMKLLNLKSFNIPLPSDWRTIIAKLAARDGMRLSQWVREKCIRPKLEELGHRVSDVARMGAPKKEEHGDE
jgi:hypothetical protein